SSPNGAGLPAGRWPVAAWVTYLSFGHNFSSGLGVKLQTDRVRGITGWGCANTRWSPPSRRNFCGISLFRTSVARMSGPARAAPLRSVSFIAVRALVQGGAESQRPPGLGAAWLMAV